MEILESIGRKFLPDPENELITGWHNTQY